MTMIRKLASAAVAIAIVSAAAPSSVIAKPTYTGLFGNVAAGGYDVTSYFAGNGTPKKGSKSYTVSYNGAIYQFASKANADLFKATPAKFAPQYGGYCSWAMANGYKAPGNPEYYKLVDGKLYLNYDKSVQEKWNKNISGFIKQANGEWQKIS